VIERALWFGEKGATTGTNGHPKRYTGGVLEHIESNDAYVQNQNGPLTSPDMEVFLREGFTYGSDTKMLFAGGKVISAINSIAEGQIQTKPLETSYGMKISTWTNGFGTINIVHNPLFVQDYAGYAFLLDMDCFRYRYLNNRDTKLKTNIEAPGTDGQVDEFLTEAGLERRQPSYCALLKNVTA